MSSSSTKEILEQFFGIGLVIVGLSHVAQPRMWLRFFAALHKTGFLGFAVALYTLPQGLVIVTMHNHWEPRLPVILTIIGWGWTIKSTLYLLFPRFADRLVPKDESESWKYAAAGAAVIVLGGLLLLNLALSTPA